MLKIIGTQSFFFFSSKFHNNIITYHILRPYSVADWFTGSDDVHRRRCCYLAASVTGDGTCGDGGGGGGGCGSAAGGAIAVGHTDDTGPTVQGGGVLM